MGRAQSGVHSKPDTPDCNMGCLGCSCTSSDRNAGLMRLPARLIDPAPHSIDEGDSFQLEAPGTMLIALSLAVYIQPVVLMLLFSVGCSVLYPERESMVIAGAVAGLVTGLGAVGLFGDVFRQSILTHLAVRDEP